MGTGLEIPIIMGVAAVAAGGLSYYSSVQQAETSEQVAAYNAAVQRQQADLNARMQTRQAEINAAMLETQINQSRATDQQAEATMRQSAEHQRRLREEKLRLIGAQRAGFAKAGVVTEGTPLAVFADTELNYALQEEDIFKTASEQATALHRQAELERMGLGTQLSVEGLNMSAASASRRIGYNNASLTRAQGASQASAYRLSGYGTLLSSAGGAVNQYSRF